MRETLVTARRALLAMVVLALVATTVPWHCCGHGTTAGGGAAAGTAVLAVVAHKAHACDDETAPLATAEPGRSLSARPAVTDTSWPVDASTLVEGVSGADPGAARGEPPSRHELCVLRT